jgi:hypothetical protein
MGNAFLVTAHVRPSGLVGTGRRVIVPSVTRRCRACNLSQVLAREIARIEP